MTDKPLFNLDAEGRWRLAYDRQQWVVHPTPCGLRLEGQLAEALRAPPGFHLEVGRCVRPAPIEQPRGFFPGDVGGLDVGVCKAKGLDGL